jgi:hypothetical protein
MRSGDRFSASAVPGSAQPAASAPPSGAPGSQPEQAGPAGGAGAGARPLARRAWAALAWALAAAALFALFLRISLGDAPTSDPANNALQAWDLLHGHLLLHGWILGDVTFYTFELPLIALVEIFFGLHTITVHVAEALVYVIVTALAVAVAVTGSRGGARVARAGVVAAVLAAPALVASDMWIPLGFPDHTGTTVFFLVPFLLIDLSGSSRGGSGGSSPPEPAERFTAPLVAVILCAGQISDVTVRYVAVPAIVVVCGYRVLVSGKFRSGDAANVVAAVVSVPLSLAVRAIMKHWGAYVMVSPKTKIAPVAHWQHNAALTWYAVRMLFGISGGPVTHPRPLGVAAVFGVCCLLLAVAGMVRVGWRWRTARRAEQLLLVVIVLNIVVYAISTLPTPRTPHDLVVVLPAGAILGARALVPRRITGRLTALAAAGVAAVAALLPLSWAAAARAPQVPAYAVLATWLEDHGLHYGLSGYWDGSSVTLQSGGAVQVRTVHLVDGAIRPFPWETNTLWYDPATHYANFVVIDLINIDLVPQAARYFGQPVSSHHVGGWEVLIYNHNVLSVVKPPKLPHTS